jgi:hypothetical protein
MSPSKKALIAAALLVLLLPALAVACPLCKDALEDQAANGGVPNELGRGFYYSILLMVSAPFAVVGGLFFRIYRSRRRGAAGAAS